MNERKLVIFDLDGTLLDTIGDLSDACNSVLRTHGYPVFSEMEYMRMIGSGISELVKSMLPSHERTSERVGYFVEQVEKEYRQCWDRRTRPYNGIPELLDKLTADQNKLAVLSNKPHPFTEKSVHKLLGKWRFDPVRGACTDVPIKPDPTGALKIAEFHGYSAKDCVFVGDSEVDIRTAKAAGMQSIAVTWGFRQKEQLAEQEPDFIAEHPRDIQTIICLDPD